MTRKISDEQLQKTAHEHISYEIQMFVQSYKKLRHGNLDQYENNSTLETFLIHARCLLDFLYPPKNFKPDDVLADDFFINQNTLRDALPVSLSISAYLKRRAGKEIVHLTYNRLNLTPQQKQWQPTDIHDQLTSALAIFFEKLTEERKAWFSVIVA